MPPTWDESHLLLEERHTQVVSTLQRLEAAVGKLDEKLDAQAATESVKFEAQHEKLAAIDRRLLWVEWKAGFWGTVGGILGFCLPASVAALLKGKL